MDSVVDAIVRVIRWGSENPTQTVWCMIAVAMFLCAIYIWRK